MCKLRSKPPASSLLERLTTVPVFAPKSVDAAARVHARLCRIGVGRLSARAIAEVVKHFTAVSGTRARRAESLARVKEMLATQTLVDTLNQWKALGFRYVASGAG